MRDTPEEVMRDRPEEVMRDEAANRPPYNQQTQPMAQPQAGNEGDPSLSREIPGTETGEQRWAGADVGAPDFESGREATTEADTMTGGMTTAGEPGLASPNVEESRQATPAPQPPSDEGYLEEPGATASSEAYGQGETREFTALGADPGIEQQEVLQSRQSQPEEQRSEQSILGSVGDMLRGLFGSAPRTPRDDEGEDAGEAHP